MMHKTMPTNSLRLTPQILVMAKELPNVNATPNVFQMFNENRTCSFESDIASLPNLPRTLPRSTGHPNVPKLQKSFSQPHLNLSAFVPAGPTLPVQPTGSLLLPAAIMASTSYQVPVQLPPKKEGSQDDNSLLSRYETEPSYGNSGVLKSFQQELKMFSHQNIQKKSFSAPNSPRRASLPNLGESLSKGGVMPFSEAESRKLSLVKEEPEKEMKVETLPVVAPQTSETKEVKSQSNPSDLMSSIPKEPVGGELLKDNSNSLTKKMMNWFITPQKQQSNTSRTEFNAITPTSF